MTESTVTPAPARGRASRFLREVTGLALMAAMVVVCLRVIGLLVVPVVSESMEPTFYPRDILVFVAPRIVSPQVGRVIVGYPVDGDLPLPATAHRIIGRDDQGWITKGDHNANPDGWRYPEAGVRGVYLFRVPFWLVTSPWLFGALVFLIAFGVLYGLFVDDDEEDEEVDEESVDGDQHDRTPGPADDGPAHPGPVGGANSTLT